MEKQNKYRVVVSEQAKQMLVFHAAFLAQVSPSAAERLTQEFEKAANSLEVMPQRCLWLSGDYIPRNASSVLRSEFKFLTTKLPTLWTNLDLCCLRCVVTAHLPMELICSAIGQGDDAPLA